MTSPYLFFKDYEFEIDDTTEKKLGLEKPEDVAVYVLLTIPGGSIKDMTANLMAPVIINQNTLDAAQLVLEKSPYQTKHRLFQQDGAGKEAR